MTQKQKADLETKLLKQLVELSHRYGKDPDFVIAGGGNTSVKTETTLYVKASGHALGSIEADGFAEMDRAKLRDVLATDLTGDQLEREDEFSQAILAACRRPEQGLRPSIECLLHEFLDDTFVVHTHSVLANIVSSCSRGEKLVEELFGGDVLWIPAADPGYMLARTIKESLDAWRKNSGSQAPIAILIQNHGLIVSGDSPEEIDRKTGVVVEKIRERLALLEKEPAFGAITRIGSKESAALVNTIAPALRGLLVRDKSLKIVVFDDSENLLEFACGENARAIADLGPLMPDQIVSCGSFPLWIEPDQEETEGKLFERLRNAVAEYKAKYNYSPRVAIVKGLGLFASGDTHALACTARHIYLGAVKVMAGAARLGGVHAMGPERRKFVEGAEVEAYRRKLAEEATAIPGRAAGKVAVVTGAAQGFGLEIATNLVEEGACVVLADINETGAVEAAENLCREHGAGRALGLPMNVTSGESLSEAIHQVVRTYGGFDIFISNAGVLKAGSVKTQPEKDFDFVTAVNYKGYFVCVQHAAPILAIQHRAKPDYRSDIIQINSKSGLAGSNRNGAYAGSKFGGIGLTQSFALELIEDGIKVNSICPGNFFEGPLWSDPESGLFVQYLKANKVPGAKTIEDVRKAYEAKVPMGRGCRTCDVMTAIYYLIEQQYETGQAVPVTGGQVMLS